MSSFATYKGNGPEFLVRGFPWASLGSKTVVDVGGSEGKYSIALAQSFPDLKFIIQDLPAVIRAVDAKRPVPSELVDRVTFMAHDMFKEQSVSADIYLYRWVFHDWPDAYVVKILRQLIPALKPGARVIINDTILPEPNTLSELQERKIRYDELISILAGAFADFKTVLLTWSCCPSSILGNVRETIGRGSFRKLISGSGL